ncbi:hypothetical protein B2J93_4318 [Marssonina coronariae]|uniref:Uncharacterized protein n=1 Tax=Diplocarpon coronariae TaxID=2795749 RepID=A0A218ZDV4_9HELO|nr:hypothetical protein B2J93_4318 [Marssonina coronariae]
METAGARRGKTGMGPGARGLVGLTRASRDGDLEEVAVSMGYGDNTISSPAGLTEGGGQRRFKDATPRLYHPLGGTSHRDAAVPVCLAVAQHQPAAMAAAREVASSLRYLQSKSAALHTRAQSLNLASGSLATGPYPIQAALDEMNSTASNLQSRLSSESAPWEGEARAVADAWKEFVRTHQRALHLLTTKAGLFTTGQPIAAVLRRQKDILDILGPSLASLLGPRQADTRAQQAALSTTLRSCIAAHARQAN